MYLDGAKWDRGLQCIDDSFPGKLYDQMKCRRSYKTQIWGYDDSGAYACPTYKITTRSGALSTTDNLLITFHFGYSIIRLFGVKL